MAYHTGDLYVPEVREGYCPICGHSTMLHLSSGPCVLSRCECQGGENEETMGENEQDKDGEREKGEEKIKGKRKNIPECAHERLPERKEDEGWRMIWEQTLPYLHRYVNEISDQIIGYARSYLDDSGGLRTDECGPRVEAVYGNQLIGYFRSIEGAKKCVEVCFLAHCDDEVETGPKRFCETCGGPFDEEGDCLVCK